MKKVLAFGAVAAVSTTIAYSAEAASHTVESGDSLWVLAEENNVTVESLKKDNNLTSDIIVPGQVLEIGGDKKAEAKEETSDKDNKEVKDTYVIESGDTLFDIAVEFDVSVAELKEWNNLSSDIIFVGKELVVSADAAPDAATPVAEPAPEVEEVEEATTNAPAEEVQEEVQQQAQPQQQQQTQSTNTNSGLNWGALAACESGGNASVVSANGLYHGLYQFDAQTWQSVGGSGVASQASAAEQTQRAQMLYDQRGSSPWPVCGSRL